MRAIPRLRDAPIQPVAQMRSSTGKLPGRNPMITRAHKVRGRPFKPGNSGRPPGSKNKVTQVLEQLAEAQAEQLYQKVSKGALAGNVRCQQMLLDRIWPLRKGQPVSVAMPPINTLQDLFLDSDPRGSPHSRRSKRVVRRYRSLGPSNRAPRHYKAPCSFGKSARQR
jgi:hypothetical protein